jgi:hypothetical protein
MALARLRRRRRRRRSLLGLGLSALLFTAGDARGADHFLTIGGGYSPSGNQVSLEKNVLFFRQVLAERYPAGEGAAAPRHDVLFSDGDSPGRDVQYADAASDVPRARRLLAQLADEEDDLGYRYRSHEIPGVRGPATRAALDRWFAEVGATLAAGDRLILYATGHGEDGDEHRNNVLNLWNGDAVTVRELAALLDGLPAGVDVVVVMVQCYSGGFADLMFAGGRPDNGPAAGTGVRCGFFATVPDRTAAGCTADVYEENYRDYSTSFWAALGGTTRTGAPVDAAARDFDADGTVTFAEAHAYALLTNESIDIPMKTSDRFLRLHSDAGTSRGRLVSAGDMLARLNALATPADRGVIEGLSRQLKMGGQYRYNDAESLAEALDLQHVDLERQENELRDRYDEVREDIRDALEIRWPELRNRWDPAVDRLLAEEAEALVGAIESDANFGEFTRLRDQLSKLAEQGEALQLRYVKCRRLMHRIESVALAHNLSVSGDEAHLARYRALVAAENGTLGSDAAKR